MIPPRGCAYIVMVHRQDANTALNKLSRGSYKVNQKPVKVHKHLQRQLLLQFCGSSQFLIWLVIANTVIIANNILL